MRVSRAIDIRLFLRARLSFRRARIPFPTAYDRRGPRATKGQGAAVSPASVSVGELRQGRDAGLRRVVDQRDFCRRRRNDRRAGEEELGRGTVGRRLSDQGLKDS